MRRPRLIVEEITDRVQPEQFLFKDDGLFPNSVLPVLVYRQAVKTDGASLRPTAFAKNLWRAKSDALASDPASVFKERFAANDWTNSWRDGVYSFPHYHSTSHELLGVYSGKAKLRLGGEHGKTFDVRSGDVIVIPAGVAHQNLGADPDFGVVGAYPGGRHWDVLRGLPGERPQADRDIAKLPLPDNDPLYGADGPLREIWKNCGVLKQTLVRSP